MPRNDKCALAHASMPRMGVSIEFNLLAPPPPNPTFPPTPKCTLATENWPPAGLFLLLQNQKSYLPIIRRSVDVASSLMPMRIDRFAEVGTIFLVRLCPCEMTPLLVGKGTSSISVRTHCTVRTHSIRARVSVSIILQRQMHVIVSRHWTVGTSVGKPATVHPHGILRECSGPHRVPAGTVASSHEEVGHSHATEWSTSHCHWCHHAHRHVQHVGWDCLTHRSHGIGQTCVGTKS